MPLLKSTLKSLRIKKNFGVKTISGFFHYFHHDHLDKKANLLGGVRAWLVFTAAVIFYFYGCLQRVAPAVIVDDFMRDFSIGAGAVGLLSSAYLIIYAGLQVPAGLLMDRHDPGKSVCIAAFLCALGALVFALAPNFSISFVGRTLVGAGAAFSWLGVLRLSAIWFPKHQFASVTGLGQAIGNLGSMAGQAPLAKLNMLYGWRRVMSSAAILGFVLSVLIVLLLMFNPRKLLLNKRNKIDEKAGTFASIITAASNKKIWFPILFGAFCATGMWAFGALWGANFLEKARGLSREDSAIASSCVFLGAMAGSPLLGMLSDRMRKRKPVIISSAFAAAVFMVILIYVHNLPFWLICVLMAACGFASISEFLNFVMVKEISLPQYAGVAVGIANALLMACSSIIQPLTGAVLDFFWVGEIIDGTRVYDLSAWLKAMAIFPICQIMAMIFASLSTESYQEQKL